MIGIVYKLAMSESDNTVYVGSTTNLRRRKHNHASTSLHAPSKVYQYIRANGGFDNFDLFEIERIEFTNKQQLYERERFHLEQFRNSGITILNKNIPSRTNKQYYEDNKTDIILNVRDYQNTHRPLILEQKNRRIVCVCGDTHNYSNKINHCKTQRHKSYLRSLTNAEIVNDIEPSETQVATHLTI